MGTPGIIIVLLSLVIALAILIYILLLPVSNVDIKFKVQVGGGQMAIVTEVDVNPGDSGTIKLIPVDNTGAEGTPPLQIENVDFTSGSGDVVLTVDIDNPLLFLFNVPQEASPADVDLSLSTDGKIGEGVSQINKVLVMHIKAKEAADVKFDVNITKTIPVPVPEPEA